MKTMLENLCEVCGRQGGTIHQYLHDQDEIDLRLFRNEYNDLVKIGITFPSKAAFNKLATKHHIVIDWR